MKSHPRILLLTAGYGEGHNSAARGILEALGNRADCMLTDACREAMPRFFRWTRAYYLWMIVHAPLLWRRTFDWTNQCGPATFSSPLLRVLKRYLRFLIETKEPDVIVSTYMMYSGLLELVFDEIGRRVPYVVVVTDSLEIHRTWYYGHADAWCVTDKWTREEMTNHGVDPERVFVTGFPVSPDVLRRSQRGVLSWQEGLPFRILYFAQGELDRIRRELEIIFMSHPNVRVTCVMGRRVRHLYPTFKKMRKQMKNPGRLKLIGWTHRVPEYLATHHLVIGKAGGATVHEVIAAGRPMLVNFAVPGQEEGNVELLEKLGGGRYVRTPGELNDMLRKMLTNDGALWRKMHESLLHSGMTGGSESIASLALKLAENRSNGLEP